MFLFFLLSNENKKANVFAQSDFHMNFLFLQYSILVSLNDPTRNFVDFFEFKFNRTFD
jgi:hypothetical protein